MSQVAVFIDAGYFWKQAGHVVHGSHSVRREDVCIDYAVLRQQLLQCVDTQFPNTRLLRIYWYDGPDMKGGKTSSHWAVEYLDDFKLRLGMRSGSDQKQKAVDGLIIADIIGLAQSKAITGAMLLSGDADLTPGVIAAQGLGIRVHLLSMGPEDATSGYLKAEVDCKASWSDATVRLFAASNTSSVFGVSINADICDDVYQELARKTLQELDHPANPVVLSKNAIPQQADAMLLRQGARHFKRKLTEPERRELRSAFKALLVS